MRKFLKLAGETSQHFDTRGYALSHFPAITRPHMSDMTAVRATKMSDQWYHNRGCASLTFGLFRRKLSIIEMFPKFRWYCLRILRRWLPVEDTCGVTKKTQSGQDVDVRGKRAQACSLFALFAFGRTRSPYKWTYSRLRFVPIIASNISAVLSWRSSRFGQTSWHRSCWHVLGHFCSNSVTVAISYNCQLT